MCIYLTVVYSYLQQILPYVYTLKIIVELSSQFYLCSQSLTVKKTLNITKQKNLNLRFLISSVQYRSRRYTYLNEKQD